MATENIPNNINKCQTSWK